MNPEGTIKDQRAGIKVGMTPLKLIMLYVLPDQSILLPIERSTKTICSGSNDLSIN